MYDPEPASEWKSVDSNVDLCFDKHHRDSVTVVKTTYVQYKISTSLLFLYTRIRILIPMPTIF